MEHGLLYELLKQNTDKLSRSLDCQRLLLEAGADPSVHSEGSSPFLKIASGGSLVRCSRILVDGFANIAKAALRLILDADPYLDLEQRDDQGRTALMLVILYSIRVQMRARYEEFYAMAVKLLDRGSDINACDINGRDCVEMAYDACLCPYFGYYHYERLQKLLVLLVDRGYDTYRADNKKISICEIEGYSKFAVTWFEALQTSKFDYRKSAVLAEDHARHHQRQETDMHLRSEMGLEGQSVSEGLEPRGIVRESAITDRLFTGCADRKCDWVSMVQHSGGICGQARFGASAGAYKQICLI